MGQLNLCVETTNPFCGGGGGERGGEGGAFGGIDIRICYTRGARSTRWCGWWARRGRWGRGGGGGLPQRHGRL